MISEINELALGIDLGPVNSQLTFYNRQNSGPRTVSVVPGEENYQIATPAELFSLMEQRLEEGVALLADFFAQCLELLATAGKPDSIMAVVTMRKMNGTWADGIRAAFERVGVPKDHVFLQDYRESFYWYMLNQRKDLWTYQVALSSCENGKVTAFEFSVERKTRPALVSIEEKGMLYLDELAREGRPDKLWLEVKDQKFLELATKMFGKRTFSSVYLVGEEFDKSWMGNSLAFLCNRRKVFMGQNLYTKGACYAAMEYARMNRVGDYLYAGPDMIEQNMGMEMIIRGHQEFYPMISAGVNWYMARAECEFVLDDTSEVILYSKSMAGEELSHTVRLPGLPDRPNRATRLHLDLSFIGKRKCRVRVTDLGLGNLYPASGKRWDAVITFAAEKTPGKEGEA